MNCAAVAWRAVGEDRDAGLSESLPGTRASSAGAIASAAGCTTHLAALSFSGVPPTSAARFGAG